MTGRHLLAGLLAGLLAAAPAYGQDPDGRPPRVLTAAPATGGIRVDGVLDEAAWAAAEATRGFVQFEPDDGQPATQDTEVRVLYGGDALYVGARLFDSEPGRVRAFLTRRDETGGADTFVAAIDAYDDGTTAYFFGVTAAGVQFDGVLQGNDDDDSWDAVWASDVRITPEGWVVEMAIPYSQLRFSEGARSWGITFQRELPRAGEESFWTPIPREDLGSGFVQFFGRLEGLPGLSPRRTLQFTPYSLASANLFEDAARPGAMDAEYGYDAGADLKVGLASNVTLDATINPDFGQVEADPAQLNLSTFETFFEERRPFFLEGTQIFDYSIGGGDGSLLYTRRIGAATPIIGAAKVSGRLASGLSFGAIGAATGDAFEPGQWYATGRLKQELGSQRYVGGAFTALESPFDADGAGYGRRALAAGADWDLRLGADDQLLLEGSLAGSAREDLDPASTAGVDRGYALYIGFDKVKGFFTPGSGLRVYSDRFQINDVGRFQQNDLISARLGGGYLLNRGNPLGPFRRVNVFGGGTQAWRYADGTNRGVNVFAGGTLEFRGFETLNLRFNGEGFGGYDVRETRGLGPVYNAATGGLNVNFTTDERRRLVLSPGGFLGLQEGGGGVVEAWADLDWTASDRLSLTFSAFAGAEDDWRAWAANESLVRTADGLFIGASDGTPDALGPDGLHPLGLDAPGADAFLAGVSPWAGPLALEGATGYYAPVFARRDVRQASLGTRANVIFRPNLSLQLYGRLFAARGQYTDFELLASPDELRPFAGYPKRRDFSFESFQANAVLRWEYRPGSALFVVWTQARDDGVEEALLLDGAPVPGSPFETGTGRQLRDVFAIYPDNVFLVKLSYLLMR